MRMKICHLEGDERPDDEQDLLKIKLHPITFTMISTAFDDSETWNI